MHRNQTVMAHDFSMVPNADIPRSAFARPHGFKTTFDAGYLVPMFIDEVLPGDTFNLRSTIFARLATPLFPIMDNMYLDTFYFFVPNRLIWTNWKKFMGEQASPGDSISYLTPKCTSPAVTGYTANSLQDYMGLPTEIVGVEHCNFWPRAYNLIFNEWFRDENLQASVVVDTDDGPDSPTDYILLRRGKRHDYFTSCLPWPQKGTAVSLPLGTTAPVVGIGFSSTLNITGTGATNVRETPNISNASYGAYANAAIDTTVIVKADGTGTSSHPAVYADLSAATSSTINAIRLAFQVQKLLERDARGGTRYTEIVRSHFGVISPDARQQRPEYLGGGTTPVIVNPIAQTSATGLTGGSTPAGNLAAMGTVLANRHGFTKSFTEHGVIIGIMNVRADLTYQQGLARMWSRSTRYDFYFPAFSHLGEQAVLNKEIYAQGSAQPAQDAAAFGYQEAWAEYRYKNSLITGQFRSNYATPLDAWHLSQNFGSLPTLNSAFIYEQPPVSRIVAIGSGANGQQFLCDIFHDLKCVRPMPMYSVPGLIDHF